MVSGAEAQTKKRQRRGGVEQRLRDAIQELAATSTFQDLRVEEIASAAGLSRSAFYFYYPGKLELLVDAARHVLEEVYEQADRWYSGPDESDSKALIVEVLVDSAATWGRHAHLLRMASEVASYDEEIGSFWRALRIRFFEGVAGRVSRDQEAGLASTDVDPESCAEILILATESYFLRNIAHEGGAPEAAAAALAPVWIRTLYPER